MHVRITSDATGGDGAGRRSGPRTGPGGSGSAVFEPLCGRGAARDRPLRRRSRSRHRRGFAAATGQRRVEAGRGRRWQAGAAVVDVLRNWSASGLTEAGRKQRCQLAGAEANDEAAILVVDDGRRMLRRSGRPSRWTGFEELRPRGAGRGALSSSRRTPACGGDPRSRPCNSSGTEDLQLELSHLDEEHGDRASPPSSGGAEKIAGAGTRGGSDYMTKPFSIDRLASAAVLQRSGAHFGPAGSRSGECDAHMFPKPARRAQRGAASTSAGGAPYSQPPPGSARDFLDATDACCEVTPSISRSRRTYLPRTCGSSGGRRSSRPSAAAGTC